MPKITTIVSVALAYTFNAKSKEDAIEQVENIELPKEYVSDSFEIVKVIDNKGREIVS